ncbi:MAG TPA: hemerythrin domain-containing protein [Polyangiaceae bacterium]|nr:hemerythrin domain-containing protein [Polyangiaceae bacterium]
MDVRRELLRDHEDHEVLLAQVASSVEAKQSAAQLRRCWLAFEENLIEHLDAEERFLFTVTAQAHRLEIGQLRLEHRGIRQAVLTLRMQLEHNRLEQEAIDELRALMLAHGAHEERTLHRWLAIDEGIMAHRGLLAMRTRRERSSPRMRVAAKVESTPPALSVRRG